MVTREIPLRRLSSHDTLKGVTFTVAEMPKKL